ncbi:mRNA decay activator protein ZFP36-like [Gadus macrocephalus]|uniref:mRNA decay activator protein ZFP36 n=1 Tax=Gadus chalcogrammus TaxID=1042646 RepID=UPI0024C4D101|nr:mRNA decay activator protein ZFP36 [Gadus chalcogrammus]XP_059930987.1 mRNA decay activator protein ZFP36-like [Gadus macrocephalus]
MPAAALWITAAGPPGTNSRIINNMPSFPFSQLVDVEDTMCQLLNLDLRDQNSAPIPLSLAMKTAGYIGQQCNSAHFSSSPSSLSQHSELMDAFLPSNHWCQKPDSPQPPEQPTSIQWARSRFWVERSLSMVETSSAGGPLGWPYLGAGRSPSLSTSPTLPSSSSASSLLSIASNSSGSSSSRYKTELCRSFAESSVCKYGNKCQFAHGLDELRDLNRHPKYKTEPCRTFHTIGFCPYGIRCHFVHNNEDDLEQPHPRSSSTSSTPCGLSQPGSFRSGRPPLLRQSFSFAGFPSAPHLQQALPTLPPPSLGSFLRAPPSAAPPSCSDITELLSHALLEMDSAFEASASKAEQHLHPQQAPPVGPASSSDPRAHFLPSPDSGCSLNGFSPATSPSLRQSPCVTAEGFVGPLGPRSLSSTSLSEPEHEGGSSSASSLSGSDGGDANARRLTVFSQLSVPEDMAEYVV